MELTDAVRRRRMSRNFTGQPLSAARIDALLTGVLQSPTAGHTQGVDFVILEGPDRTSLYWSAATDHAWRSRSRRFEGLQRAPVIVLPFADPEAYAARYREPDKVRGDGADVEWVVPFWFVDAAFATMALLLGATDDGLGTAFLGNFRGEDALRSALGVPARFRWLGAILLGEEARPDPPSSSLGRDRRHFDDVVHRGHW
jgi:nitroreductase